MIDVFVKFPSRAVTLLCAADDHVPQDLYGAVHPDADIHGYGCQVLHIHRI